MKNFEKNFRKFEKFFEKFEKICTSFELFEKKIGKTGQKLNRKFKTLQGTYEATLTIFRIDLEKI